MYDDKLNMSQQCMLASQKANYILVYIKRNIGIMSREVTLLLYFTLMWPTWSTVFSRGVSALDRHRPVGGL